MVAYGRKETPFYDCELVSSMGMHNVF